MSKQPKSKTQTDEGIVARATLLSDVHETLQAEVREHRAHLESLMKRVMTALSLIATFLVGVTAVLGFKTYYDIEAKLKADTSTQIKQVITEEYLEAKVRQSFDNTLLSNRLTLLKTEDFTNFSERSRVGNPSAFSPLIAALQSEDDMFVAEATDIIEKLDLSFGAQRAEICDSLTDLLSTNQGKMNFDLSPSLLADVISSTGHLGCQSAIESLVGFIAQLSVDRGVSRAALIALPRIDLADKLFESQEKLFELAQRPGLDPERVSELHIALFKIGSEEGYSEIIRMASSPDPEQVNQLLSFLRASPSSTPNLGDRKKFQALYQTLFLNAAVDFYAKSSESWGTISFRSISDIEGMSDENRKRSMRVDRLWAAALEVRTNGTRLSFRGDSLLSDRDIQAAIMGAVLNDAEQGKDTTVRILNPIAAYGELALLNSIDRGLLGPNADPWAWKTLVSFKLKTADPERYIWKEHDSESNLVYLDTWSSAGGYRTIAVPLLQVDFSSVELSVNSFDLKRSTFRN